MLITLSKNTHNLIFKHKKFQYAYGPFIWQDLFMFKDKKLMHELAINSSATFTLISFFLWKNSNLKMKSIEYFVCYVLLYITYTIFKCQKYLCSYMCAILYLNGLLYLASVRFKMLMFESILYIPLSNKIPKFEIITFHK